MAFFVYLVRYVRICVVDMQVVLALRGGPEVVVEFSIGVLLQIVGHVTFAYIPTNGFRWGCVPLRCLCELDIE